MELKIESELEVTIGSFDSAESALLRSGIDARRPPISGPRRLAWPRTSPFHGGNTGSNPVGDAKSSQELTGNGHFWRRHKKAQLHRELSGQVCAIASVSMHPELFL